MKLRLDDLTEQVARQRAAQVAAQAEQERQAQTIRDWMSAPSDPLVLALPAKKTIRDETLAIVGPAWGELPAELVKVFGLKSTKALRGGRR